jgi:hypothetical protein
MDPFLLDEDDEDDEFRLPPSVYVRRKSQVQQQDDYYYTLGIDPAPREMGLAFVRQQQATTTDSKLVVDMFQVDLNVFFPQLVDNDDPHPKSFNALSETLVPNAIHSLLTKSTLASRFKRVREVCIEQQSISVEIVVLISSLLYFYFTSIGIPVYIISAKSSRAMWGITLKPGKGLSKATGHKLRKQLSNTAGVCCKQEDNERVDKMFNTVKEVHADTKDAYMMASYLLKHRAKVMQDKTKVEMRLPNPYLIEFKHVLGVTMHPEPPLHIKNHNQQHSEKLVTLAKSRKRNKSSSSSAAAPKRKKRKTK